MAIYHLSVKTISRSKGRSATASAAYRSAEKIEDLRTGLVHDYSRKRGVESTIVILPAQVPAWAVNRSALWNAAEQAETRKNATVAREFELALPSELTAAQRRDLAHAFAREIVTRHSCAADVAIHAPTPKSDERNYHAHILITTRRLEAHGFTEKTRELDDRRSGEIEHWRQQWTVITNQHLERAGYAQRIDHRTLEAQGIDREPTHHLGPAATEYEHRTGEPSRRRLETEPSRELADINRDLNRTQRDLERTTLYVSDLEEARRGRAQALAEKRAESEQRRQAEERQARERQTQPAHAERERIERMTAKELAAEIQRLTPRPVEDVLQERPEMTQARAQTERFWRQALQAHDTASLARYEAEQWRKAHPIRARLHDTGVTQAYLTQREQTERAQSQQEQTLTRQMRIADYQTRQVADRLRPLLVAEQAPIWTRIAELERLRQAKAIQEQAQESLQAAQKPPETAPERRQAAPPLQPLPTPTLELTAAQKPLQTAPERRQAAPPPQATPDGQASPQAVQERPLTALEQEKARQLRDAFDRLDKRTALERFPELMRLYVLVAEAARFAKEKMLDPQNRADFVEDIKERGIRELAQGKTLPKPAVQPEHTIERTRERGRGPSR